MTTLQIIALCLLPLGGVLLAGGAMAFNRATRIAIPPYVATAESGLAAEVASLSASVQEMKKELAGKRTRLGHWRIEGLKAKRAQAQVKTVTTEYPYPKSSTYVVRSVVPKAKG
jgi:hypothetical protein